MNLTALPEKIESLIAELPARESAHRFFVRFAEKHSAGTKRLLKNEGLLADVLALAAWSPFLATTILEHPEYIAWLGRKRNEAQVRTKEELLESLARFSLTNSSLEPHVLLARFRRRELLRIYLRDIRHLATIAEITEEISNLADAVLEHALRLALQELSNRYGVPLEITDKGRTKTAQFCVVALGKLGSRELNYASDIDLLFLYSNNGTTSGTGTRGAVTNREFFVKLAEKLTGIVGAQSHEGAAYRVDLRLRPNGRVGTLAISLAEAVDCYQSIARDWERQVLIRARSAAGEREVFKTFYEAVEHFVFQPDVGVSNALANVRQSKDKINLEHKSESGFNVKLGKGGIREIEFIAQALQLAHGGRDKWLRAPHTLISLSRLAEHKHITESELTALSDAYAFLRSLEHRLQMENGLQTHAVPHEIEKRRTIASRMNCPELSDFESALALHLRNVTAVFERVFDNTNLTEPQRNRKAEEKASIKFKDENQKFEAPSLPTEDCELNNYRKILLSAVESQMNFHDELAALRVEWAKIYRGISALDEAAKINLREACDKQTELAEASLEAALLIVKKELLRKFEQLRLANDELPLAVLGLGNLGSRGMDYGSDLDLILIYDDKAAPPVSNLTHAEFYSRAAEIFVTALSSLTREGHLYRVDLRLRPDGKNGASASGAKAFLNYLETRADVWELLAYVKLRAAAGTPAFAGKVEHDARRIVHERALKIGAAELKSETRRIRERLEAEKTRKLRRGEIDIKYGVGGLLDVYFAIRFLQLRDNVPDEDVNRSTDFTLLKLRENNSLDAESFEALFKGYEFLRRTDHALRLASKRSTRLPTNEHPLLIQISERLKFTSSKDLLENLILHTANIRRAFEKLLA